MFRFTIRDVLWLIVLVGLALSWLVQRADLVKARQVAALNAIRVEAVTALLNQRGYYVGWFDEHGVHGPFRPYPMVEQVGPPVSNSDVPPSTDNRP